MPDFSQSPTFNLKAVLKKTGLKAEVLRAWERRYEFPKPQRTPGGHRLYSESDIEALKWLRARQAEGLSISRAIELWKEIKGAGIDPLGEYASRDIPSTPNQLPATETRIEILRQNWLEASLAFDSLKADEVLTQAFALYPVETVCVEILQKSIGEIGNYWYLGKSSVQQEHFASALANRRLETLIAATPEPTRKHTILLGCPSGERHTFSLLLLNLFLRRKGLKVIYLGADVPLEQLEETTNVINPSLIVLAAQQLATAATLRSTMVALRGKYFQLAYGGLIFNRIPQIRALIPAHFLGESLEGAMHQIERLLSVPIPSPAVIPGNNAYTQLAETYLEKRAMIEIALIAKLEKDHIHIKHLDDANFFFGNILNAALELGDPAYIEADLEWVRKLLTGRDFQAGESISYLTAYNHTIRTTLGEVSAPITEWLDIYLTQEEM